MRAACPQRTGLCTPIVHHRRASPRAAAAVTDVLTAAGAAPLPAPLPTLSSAAAAVGAAAVAAASSLALAAAASGRIDYATTARLEAVVKPGPSTESRSVLILAPPDKAASRCLFLLPDRVRSVTVCGPGLDADWWTKAGAQAGVAVKIAGSLESLAGLPAASFDAALVRGDVLGALSGADPSGRARTTALRSIARALAPGAAAVIIERLAGGGPLAGLARLARRAPGPGMPESDLAVLLESVTEAGVPAGGKVRAPSPAGFARVALDVVAAGLDPTAVVVAVTAPRPGGVAAAGSPAPGRAAAGADDDAPAIEGRVRGRGKKGGGGGGRKGGFGDA